MMKNVKQLKWKKVLLTKGGANVTDIVLPFIFINIIIII